MPDSFIRVEGARQNNLKNLTFDLPLGTFTVLTGLSGSGKSSLAFQTLYAEGQRRYVETFSPYTRQFLERMDKPLVDRISGIPPAIAIGQANHVRTSRSTVGTMTEIADYLKLLFARCATLHCPMCQRPIQPWAPDELTTHLIHTFQGQRILILCPVSFPQDSSWAEASQFLKEQSFLRYLHHGKIQRLDSPTSADPRTLGHKGKLELLLVLDRLSADPSSSARITEAITLAFSKANGEVRAVAEEGGEPLRFANRYYCPWDDIEFDAPSPGLFSFNNPVGACPTCKGFGRTIEIDYDLALPDRSLSVKQGVVKPFQTESFRECQRDLLKACAKNDIDINAPFHTLPEPDQQFIIHGRKRNGRTLDELYESGDWYGINGFFQWLETKTYKMHVRILLARYRAYRTCPDCKGTRFHPRVLNWRLNGKTIADINEAPVQEIAAWFQTVPSPDSSAEQLLHQIRARLGYIENVGLGYLNLNRSTRTLSGGEFQRVNLTTCLGSALTGTLFVLDEPSIGLHPRDNALLTSILITLKDKGNTVLVVEHDEAIIHAADHLLELGPAQGDQGGQLVFQGSPADLVKNPHTITGQYLSGQCSIPIPQRRAIPAKHPSLQIQGATCHNIHNLDITIPLKRFVVITGVSGSGKSSLVHDVIHKNILHSMRLHADEPAPIQSIHGIHHIREAILVDQSPLAQTPRSTPILYIEAYDIIRDLFASTPLARQTGLTASSFSFNSGTGRCERCQGMGYEKINMQFLSDLYVTCPVCEGKRFQKSILEILWNGQSIADVLGMTVHTALAFFSSHQEPSNNRTISQQLIPKLQLLEEVGLGYLTLGQPLNNLSGGEAQRLKLVAQLSKAQSSRSETKTSLLILDEPTTGLHLHDVRILIAVLHKLIHLGHSLLIIEHHLDVMAQADHIIDMGPGAGAEGGKIIATGTPEAISRSRHSITGRFLATKLNQSTSFSKKTPLKERISPYKIRSFHKGTEPSAIQIRGARHHNLKNISLDIPHNRFVVLTGLSGSGKSSLAFDLLFAEGRRRYLDCLSSYARQFVEQLEKPEADSINGIPPAVAIEQRTSRGGAKSTVATVTEIYQFLRLLYARLGVLHDPDTDEPAIRQSADEIALAIKNRVRSKGPHTLLAPLIRGRKGIHTEVAKWALKHGYQTLYVNGKPVDASNFKPLDRYREHTIDLVISQLTTKSNIAPPLQAALDIGKGTIYLHDTRNIRSVFSTMLFCPSTGRSFDPPDPRLFSFNSPHGWCPTCQGYGTIATLSLDGETEAEREQQAEAARESDELVTIICPDCKGARLNPIARAVRFAGLPVPEINRMSVDAFHHFFSKLKWKGRDAAITRDIAPEIIQRLLFLKEAGLGYLALDRSAPTLSGGESQRIRLSAQLGSNLQGVLYVLDEPTIGLHPRDNANLLSILGKLRDRGNSLIVVEHDEDTIRACDRIIDLGPGAGVNGGYIVAQGSWQEIAKQTHSATGLLLGKPLQHPLRGFRRPVLKSGAAISLKKITARHLKGFDLLIPLHRLIVITGVSGSGKSTLLNDVLAPAVNASIQKAKPTAKRPWQSISGVNQIARVVSVDQSPIGKTSRSTVCTYVGIMDHLRQLFSQLPEARMRGFTASHFSHNSGDGRCPDCKGQGTMKVEMNFLPPTFVPCETCGGKRWTKPVLDVRLREKSIYDVLNMNVETAAEFFHAHPTIATPLRILTETGLGYITLGQTSPTLSGGEAQRIKLVTELASAELLSQRQKLRSLSGKTDHQLYLLEEPTVGLHLADVERLIGMLHRLVDAGHTVVVIEHNLDLIAEADYIIDLGPEGGEKGGHLLFNGTPEQLARRKSNETGRFLKPFLAQRSSRKRTVDSTA